MTRKDYVVIAAALRRTKPTGYNRSLQWRNDCLAISDELAIDNERFDQQKFLDACGFDEVDAKLAVEQTGGVK